MGSKTPLARRSPQDGRCADDLAERLAASIDPASVLLLTRIAEALHVPPSALYGPHSAADPLYLCAELVDAFTRIRDAGERERILALVRQVAEQP